MRMFQVLELFVFDFRVQGGTFDWGATDAVFRVIFGNGSGAVKLCLVKLYWSFYRRKVPNFHWGVAFWCFLPKFFGKLHQKMDGKINNIKELLRQIPVRVLSTIKYKFLN